MDALQVVLFMYGFFWSAGLCDVSPSPNGEGDVSIGSGEDIIDSSFLMELSTLFDDTSQITTSSDNPSAILSPSVSTHSPDAFETTTVLPVDSLSVHQVQPTPSQSIDMLNLASTSLPDILSNISPSTVAMSSFSITVTSSPHVASIMETHLPFNSMELSFTLESFTSSALGNDSVSFTTTNVLFPPDVSLAISGSLVNPSATVSSQVEVSDSFTSSSLLVFSSESHTSSFDSSATIHQTVPLASTVFETSSVLLMSSSIIESFESFSFVLSAFVTSTSSLLSSTELSAPLSSTIITPLSTIVIPSSSTIVIPSSSTIVTPSSSTIVTPSSSTIVSQSSSTIVTPSSSTIVTPSFSTIVTPSSSTIVTPSSSTIVSPSSTIVSSLSSTIVIPSSSTIVTPSSSTIVTPSSSTIVSPSSTIVSSLSSTIVIPSSSTIVTPSSSSPTITPSATPISSIPIITITTLNSTSIRVSWNPIPDVSGYFIYITLSQPLTKRQLPTPMKISVIGGDITSHVVTGLIPGSSYIIEMTSVDANGEESRRSGGSPVITAEDVPGPPRNVTWYEIQDGHLNVTWLPPSSPNGLIIRYTITVTYDNDVTIVYNVTSNELFILIPRPPTNGVFTISVVAVNSVGASQPMDAIMMERSSIPPGALVGIILAVILLVVVAILCLLIIMYLVWRKWLHGSGLEDNIGEIEYKTNNKDVDLINVIDGYDTNCIDGDDSQLTAKRWMRANANYSTPSVLLPSISELVSRYSTAEDVVATKTISRPQLNGLSTLSEAPFESNNSSSERSQDAPSTLSSVCSKETNKVVGLTSFELSEREAKMRDSEIVDGNQPLFEMMENVYLPSPFDKQCLEEYFKDESSISLREQIGSGDHNKVMAGLIGSCEDIVAVKLIKDECVSEEEFLGAGYIMSQLNHDNILGLMGVVLSPLMLVVPYMELCDLKKYLVRVRRRTRLEHQPCNFTVKDQLNISLQVASGMEYLSSKFYIHKCLQSKYVLLDEDFNVKISGFQMSRVLSNPGRFHELKMADRLPTKWFALETLSSDRFNPYTDVWSFGVVLWEIFAYGLTPYRGLSNRDIADHLSKGERLNKPSDCPDDIYTLMLHCWNIKCRERPTFNQLCTHLRGISEATKSSIQQQSSPTAFNIFDFSGLPSLDQSENVTTLERDNDQLEMGVVLRNPRNTPVLLPEEQGRDSNNSVSLSIPELVLSAQPRDSVNIVQTIIGANNQLMSTEDYTVL